jgi:2-dehydropantoate 2-reductase
VRFVIFGSGAIGGTVGGKLAETGQEVALIARGAHGAAIRERGLRLETPEGAITVRPAVVDHPAKLDWRADDVVLLAVKSQDAAEALRDLAAVAPAEIAVACLTNGLEAERLALRHFARVLGVVVFAPTTFLEPGVIEVWSSPVAGVLDLGSYPEQPDGVDLLGNALMTIWNSAGFSARVHADVMRHKRGKLLSNLANAAEALCGPAARQGKLAEALREEGLACYTAAALSTTTPSEDAERWAQIVPKQIVGRTRGGGSTWQSLARGADRVECDYLNGEIALMGRLHGVATPINERLQRLIATAARQGATPGAMALEELERKLGL